tara:strand:+ start:103 stop:399 length:297 start_codon:yes stop_codon:yes gene_type:complete
MKQKNKVSSVFALLFFLTASSVFLMTSELIGAMWMRQYENFTPLEIFGVNSRWPGATFEQQCILTIASISVDVEPVEVYPTESVNFHEVVSIKPHSQH